MNLTIFRKGLILVTLPLLFQFELVESTLMPDGRVRHWLVQELLKMIRPLIGENITVKVVQKPIAPEVLLQTIREVLDQEAACQAT